MRWYLQLLVILITHQAIAQNTDISGYVFGQSKELGKIPLPYVNIFWMGTQVGVLTDETGFFKLQTQNQEINQLVVSYVGYTSDTIQVYNLEKTLEIVLMPTIDLDEIYVDDKRVTHSISTIEPINVEVITSDGLQQLACCSLAESFESTVTIDVGYTDAVSGAKQIKMLGLAGVYSQMLTENQPSIRILSSTYGLNYIPGPWMSGISISKGTASVINGYESITGQINIDLKKPESSEILYAELFINEHQRVEINASSAFKINDKLSSIVLLHGSGLKNKVDNNNDGFMDLPTGNLFIVSNRYFYNSKGKFRSRFGFEFMQEDRIGGQHQLKTCLDDFFKGFVKGIWQGFVGFKFVILVLVKSQKPVPQFVSPVHISLSEDLPEVIGIGNFTVVLQQGLGSADQPLHEFIPRQDVREQFFYPPEVALVKSGFVKQNQRVV